MVNATTRPSRRALAATTGAMLLASAFGVAASAAPTVEDKPTSLTIHKHEQSEEHPAGDPADGLEQTVTSPVLEGVEFTIQKLEDYDLLTNDGWADLVDLADDFDPQASDFGLGSTTLGPAEALTTDSNGVAFFDDLQVGAYIVSETDVPAGVTPALPFLITLPMTHPNDLDTWIYDVHVYPKNSITDASKTVEEGGSFAVGQDVTWTITTDIPYGEGTFDEYIISDDLDEKLGYVSTEVYVGDDLLVEGVDYDLVAPAVGNNGEISIEFTEAGLTHLENNRDRQVQVKITTTILEMGEIENSVTFTPPGPTPPILVPPAVTKFGNFQIEKVTAGTGDPLGGAVFSVYLSEQDARDGVNAIEIDGETEFVSGSDGIVSIEGLRYSGWANNQEVDRDDDEFITYWLGEVKAPAGFELLAAPISFEVDSQDSGIAAVVKNVPKNVDFEIPVLGAGGTTTFIASGVILALAGAGVLILRSRKTAAV